MNTRELEHDEMPAVLKTIAENFWPEGREDLLGQVDLEHMQRTWAQLHCAGLAAILACYDEHGVLAGALGAMLSPSPHTGDTSAQEVFWYVLPEYRGTRAAAQLIRAYEVWAKRHGARFVLMAHLTHLMPAAIGRFYRLRGYRQTETIYTKEIAL